jgi:hypothetical protein
MRMCGTRGFSRINQAKMRCVRSFYRAPGKTRLEAACTRVMMQVGCYR